MKSSFFSVVTAIALVSLSSFGALADSHIKKPLGVVELFTSQGCSSCPPADKVLSQLIEEGEVIALSYHVDYWNYLGWEDTLSSQASTARQYNYAKTLKRRGVYTPQAILNGRTHIVGSNYNGIKLTLAGDQATNQGLTVPVGIDLEDDQVNISIGQGNGKADIVIVYFDGENTIDIKRGENRGKKITYHHSVTDIQTIGMWDGNAQNITLPASVVDKIKSGGCAVLLQSMTDAGTPAQIIGASSFSH